MDRVTIENQSKDLLTSWCWCFYYSGHVLWLDSYAELQRPTRRHSFKAVNYYNRLSLRESNMTEADVVLPPDVMDAAVAKFCGSLKVKRWSERGVRN